MGRFNNVILVWSLSLMLCFIPYTTFAQLSPNHYANICPNVQSIVRSAVQKKFQQTFVTVPATLRLFFHDCFVQVINSLI
jgi:peroxidase